MGPARVSEASLALWAVGLGANRGLSGLGLQNEPILGSGGRFQARLADPQPLGVSSVRQAWTCWMGSTP